MGLWAWLVLLGASAALATVAQYVFFSNDREPTDYDWVYIAGGALIGGFTGQAWYPGFGGPTVDGLFVIPALAGLILGASLVESVYRVGVRPRQA